MNVKIVKPESVRGEVSVAKVEEMKARFHQLDENCQTFYNFLAKFHSLSVDVMDNYYICLCMKNHYKTSKGSWQNIFVSWEAVKDVPYIGTNLETFINPDVWSFIEKFYIALNTDWHPRRIHISHSEILRVFIETGLKEEDLSALLDRCCVGMLLFSIPSLCY